MNSVERSANSGRKINDRQIIKIETERLLLYPIGDKEMVQLVENEQDADLKQAYSEMLQSCVSETGKRIWHAVPTIPDMFSVPARNPASCCPP